MTRAKEIDPVEKPAKSPGFKKFTRAEIESIKVVVWAFSRSISYLSPFAPVQLAFRSTSVSELIHISPFKCLTWVESKSKILHNYTDVL